jgi:hypothetical protein
MTCSGVGSPSPSYTTLPSLTNSASASCSDISSLYSQDSPRFPHRPFSSPRVNEHLAVLLPKTLWKVSFVDNLPRPPSSCNHSQIPLLHYATTSFVAYDLLYLKDATIVENAEASSAVAAPHAGHPSSIPQTFPFYTHLETCLSNFTNPRNHP